MMLSPPWYTFNSLMIAALGADPEVKVSALTQHRATYSMDVMTPNKAKSQALAAVLIQIKQLGNVTVTVSVPPPNQEDSSEANLTPTQLAGQLNTALKGNPYFIRTEIRPFVPGRPDAVVFAIFAAKVVQFYNDDLSDYYQNANIVAADAFKQILQPKGNMGPYCSTEKVR